MPYWRLSGFYLFYFGALGILVPFWGLYLKGLGYDAVAIGQLMAIPMATKFVAPFVWGWLGDHLGHRMRIVRLGSLLTSLIFAGVFFFTEFWPLAAAMMLFSFFWNAVLPQFEVVTFRYLGDQAPRYAQVRAWGSIGFILTVSILGVAVDARGPAVILPVLFAVYMGIWLSSLLVNDPDPEPHPLDQIHLWHVVRQPAVLAFFAACFLMQLGHGPYYAFYSIFMEAQGWSKTLIGQLWALGVIAEVVIFAFSHRLLHRFGARRMLLVSFSLAAARWILIGAFPDRLAVLLAAQTLHAATFGVFHASAIHLVHRYFVGKHQGRGQALYSSISYGAGGAVGSLAAGFLWEGAGPLTAFLAASAISFMALLIAWRWVADAD
ncbi:MAG: MFS transporter [Gammaproteobacteria bacterium RIFOXYA12_FULL_61_12]|nr:MAG: MFS transporter [Gammaproteobacteria bacterium RIFOXYD12_FULL_61_37]OGT91172.1 MAG: MFS transporter [Gammaproteobacteria bacterium RIFOXYA12_FULL_61_12]